MTTATNTALLININVGLVAILAAVVLREELTRRTLYGLSLGLAGVVLISTNGDLGSILDGSFAGDLMVFGAGAMWAVYIVYLKRTLQRQTDVLMVSTAIIAETTLFLVPLTLLFAQSYDLPGGGTWTVLYTGLLCTGGAFLLYTAGLQRVKASVSAVLLLVEPVFGILFAVLLLQEWPAPVAAGGAALILLSIGIIAFANGRSEEPNGTSRGPRGPGWRRPW
jgi:DME family drug/metabolite transporter